MEKELILMCDEGDESLRDEIVKYIEQKYATKAVIVPGVIKRTK